MENKIKELWISIIDYIHLYMISNYGRIKSLKYGKEKILKPKIDKEGYSSVNISKNNIRKIFYIHRLVLEAFVGPCPVGMEVCHNDGNPSNNFIGNLRYDTHFNNIQDAVKHGTLVGNSKLNEKQVRIIKYLLKTKILTQKEIGKIFCVNERTISAINNNKTWKEI